MTIIYSTNTLVSKNEGSGKHPPIWHFVCVVMSPWHFVYLGMSLWHFAGNVIVPRGEVANASGRRVWMELGIR